jgi:SNF2 family DNA or RNA helicase
MLTTLYVELQAGEVTAVNEAVKAMRLVQIASGVAYGAGGAHLEVGAPARVQECLDVIEQASSKVIIFCPFKGTMEYVAREIGKHYTVECINGDVSKSERDRIFHAFQTGREPRVLVAQPAAMSHGLTLTAANTVVWYAPIYSQEIYAQANARVTRPGQKHSQLIVNIEGSPIERRIYAMLQSKAHMEGLLLDIIRAQEDC